MGKERQNRRIKREERGEGPRKEKATLSTLSREMYFSVFERE